MPTRRDAPYSARLSPFDLPVVRSANPRALLVGAAVGFSVSIFGTVVQSTRGSVLGVAGNLVAMIGIGYALLRYRQSRSVLQLANIMFPSVIAALAIVDVSWGGFGPTALVWPTVTVVASVWVGPRVLPWLSGGIVAFITTEAVLMALGVLHVDAPMPLPRIAATWVELTAATVVSTVVGSWVYRALQAEAELLAERSQAYRATVEELGVGVWEVDLASGLSVVSDQLADLLELPKGQLTPEEARAWLDAHLSSSDVAKLGHALEEVADAGHPRELEVQIAGRFPAVWLRLRLRLDVQGDGRFIRSAVQDISETRLRDQRRTTFMAMMSHELRTPLAGLLGSAELLRDAPLEGEHRRYLETVLKGGDHIRGIFDELLDFTRIDADVVELTRELVDVRALLFGVVDLFGVRAREAGLDLSLAVAASVPERVTTDPVRVRQVVVNLVSNAIKFTSAGAVRVRVAVVAGRLQIRVADTGVGIDEDALERVFDPYERGRFSRGDGPSGQGLGLAITRKIVERLGGTVRADSTPGRGSTFTVSLPCVADRQTWDQPLKGAHVAAGPLPDGTAEVVRVTLEEAGATWVADPHPGTIVITQSLAASAGAPRPLRLQVAGRDGDLHREVSLPVLQSDLVAACLHVLAPREVAPEPPASQPAGGQATLSILLVEDDPINLAITQALIEREGHTVETASDGVHAVNAVMEKRYDLVLMDLSLPVLPGLGAVRRIRAEASSQPFVVAFTADARPTVHAEATAAGCEEVLFKPASMDALRDLLARAGARSERDGAG